jgi:prepilin-type N-terminal cleavage/methylation domain-containing protein
MSGPTTSTTRHIPVSGFSLVELSIVLVILGLLTGGILTGQNLIRAAELRSIVTDFQRFQASMQTFRDQYLSMPGDMTNAIDFWTAPGGNPANCPATAGTGTQTCNGNGDGVLSQAPAANQYGEQFTFWQHQTNAGLLEGTYTGRAGTAAGFHHLAGINSPMSKISLASWGAFYRSGQANHFQIPYGNTLQFGQQSADGTNYNPVLRPEEAWNIDKKLDDGKPAHGIITPMTWNSNCVDATSGADLDADYSLDYTSIACFLVFRNLL